MKTILSVAGLLLLLAACAPGQPTAASVPRERRTQCAVACRDIDMKLSAVVVMANQVGCVCEPDNKLQPAEETVSGASAAGGMVAILIAEQQQQTYRTTTVR